MIPTNLTRSSIARWRLADPPPHGTFLLFFSFVLFFVLFALSIPYIGFLGKFNLCLMLFKQVNFNNFVWNALLSFDLLLLSINPLILTYGSTLGIDVQAVRGTREVYMLCRRKLVNKWKLNRDGNN